jgi:hypothetical protein
VTHFSPAGDSFGAKCPSLTVDAHRRANDFYGASGMASDEFGYTAAGIA